MAYPTRWYSSTMQGAPALSGQVGVGITFLNALLVDGFGELTLTSLVVASNVATATISGGHAYKQWQVVQIAGATPSGLNGEKRVLSVTGTTFTFATSGISDQTAAGTITVKVPGAGWTKPYTGTNKAAYRTNSVTGTGCYLRVDDSGTTDMRVIGNKTMSDIDTGTDTFPTSAQVSGGLYWRKSSVASATARPWVAVADDRGIYLCVNSDGAGTGYFTVWAGDFVSFAGASGAWDYYLAGGVSAGGSAGLGALSGNASTRGYLPRKYDETPGALQGGLYGINFYSGKSVSADTYPSPVTGGIIAVEGVFVLEGTPGNIRGRKAGYVQMLNNCKAAFTFGVPYFLDGIAEPILPMFEVGSVGDVFGVTLGDWR